MRVFLFFLFVLSCNQIIIAQTLGGNAVFSFLKLPNSAQQSAVGGINISTFNNDVANAWANPALLRNSMHKQLSTSYNAFLGGINQLGLVTAFKTKRDKISIGGGLQFFDYGSLTQTDPAGNTLGNFRAADYAVQLMASTAYKENFRLGLAVKMIQSRYGQFQASGLGVDVGLAYYDTTKGLQASLLVKNIGVQLKSYEANGNKEELPFDIQAGISYASKQLPLQISLTAQQLNTFAGDIGSHCIISAEYRFGTNVELYAGYNFLRGKDLSISNGPNALNGFSTGFGLLFKKFTVQYATGFYQKNLFHHFSLNLAL